MYDAENYKEIEIYGCIELPKTVSRDEFAEEFLAWLESKEWFFGGGIHDLTNGRLFKVDIDDSLFVPDNEEE